MRRFASLAMATAIMTAGATARGGALGKVVNGLDQAAGNDDHGRAPSGSGDDDDDDDSSSSSSSYSSDDNWSWEHAQENPTEPLFYVGPYPSWAGQDPANLSIYMGLQNVVDSDGAAALSVRAAYGNAGVTLSDTSYFEKVPQLDGSRETLRLDVWSIALSYRAIEPERGARDSVWLHAGVAGTSTSTDTRLIGGTVGAELLHNVSGALGAEASARLFVLQEDVRGAELRAGVAASVLRLSYRVLKLNVGPALHGPEVGLAFSF